MARRLPKPWKDPRQNSGGDPPAPDSVRVARGCHIRVALFSRGCHMARWPVRSC